MRRVAKRLAERILTSPPALGVLRRKGRGRHVILAYHNILPSGEEVTGEPGAHLPVEEFRWQLDLLEEFCAVMSLEALLEDAAAPEEGELRAAITFDDAYRGTVLTGVPELATRGLPGTVFVPPGFVGGGTFWWDDLAVSGWAGDRAPLELCRGEDRRVREWALEREIPLRSQGPSQVVADVEELRRAAARGITFGVHSWGHPNLARLSGPEAAEELRSAREWLEREGLPVVPWVAYPYGLHSPGAVEAVKELGFRGGLTIAGRWVPSPLSDPYRVPRVNMAPGLTPQNFLLRLFGVVKG